MKSGLTELVFILDRSGSMSPLVADTIGGYNSMVEKQRGEDGEAHVTTVLFDDKYEVLYDCVPLDSVKPLTTGEYFARGSTALLDAIGRTVNSVGARLSATPEEERPEKVIVAITTDGQENASHEFTYDTVKQMIETQQNVYSWTFMFIGANIDAIKEAGNLGIKAGFARSYTANSDGVGSVYMAMSGAMSVMRKASMSGVDLNEDSEEYEAVQDALNNVK